MTGYNHTLAGCIIAATIPAPVAPFASFASHFVLDAFPHFGNSSRFTPFTTDFKRLLALDGLLCIAALALGIWLHPQLWWLTALCAFTSTLPDFMWLLGRGRVKQLDWFFKFSSYIQWGERPWGYTLEVMYAIIFVWWLFQLT